MMSTRYILNFIRRKTGFSYSGRHHQTGFTISSELTEHSAKKNEQKRNLGAVTRIVDEHAPLAADVSGPPGLCVFHGGRTEEALTANPVALGVRSAVIVGVVKRRLALPT